jgi:hypothetical protein
MASVFAEAGDRLDVTNVMLGPLADNGGMTPTYKLVLGSPAIDAGDPTAVAGENGHPMYDQRGEPFTRVYGGRIDIGAFEYHSKPPLTTDFTGDGLVTAADYVVWRKFGPAVSALGQAVSNFALVSNVTFDAAADSPTSAAANVTERSPQSTSVVGTAPIDVVIAPAAQQRFAPRRFEESRLARFSPQPRPDLLRVQRLRAEYSEPARAEAFAIIATEDESEVTEFGDELLDAAFTTLSEPL